ncbi:4-hydroxy-3-methylbut-2-enyl diphosphate reductase [Cyclospora cayetanensis]|uniref:4-hydroxy-3-methylbut-2-enyl diphosphate reductase n=1 Tax=Cyclospora cayetanensis TaxID=88456 RepID=A0A1D3CYX6_9EIME|nr:4-hydroxy-3-methylbut-2-enyl diphosphate reductase [Cyclospora cayetanensis]
MQEISWGPGALWRVLHLLLLLLLTHLPSASVQFSRNSTACEITSGVVTRQGGISAYRRNTGAGPGLHDLSAQTRPRALPSHANLFSRKQHQQEVPDPVTERDTLEKERTSTVAPKTTAVAEGAATLARPNVALLAAPRGFCEGVSRAVGAVEEALRVFGSPVYVKHQIVHNEFVCKQLEDRGAIFVEDIEEVPPNSVVVFSAHGIPPSVRDAAKARGLTTVDATCPLVQKVHVYVKQKANEGYQIGVKGEASDKVQVVESEADVAALTYPPDTKLFYVTQTTLSVLDCMRIEQALRAKYPHIETIPSGSVCYATTNRQAALGALSAHADLALVVGSPSSSNAKRLVEVAKSRNIPAYLVPTPESVDPKWLKGVKTVVVSASASTPEALTNRVMQRLAELGVSVQQEALAVNETKPTWKLPKNLRDAAQLLVAKLTTAN